MKAAIQLVLPFLILLMQQLPGTGYTAASDRVRLVKADSLVSISVDGREMTELWGDVELIQGEAPLKCEQGRWWEHDDKIILIGGVSIHDGERTLISDWVDYDGTSRTEKAI